ncbi:MAG: phage tail sheath subtilisin-like domain-containing protein [Neisseria sp.]|nr:phage tail sheath subtilisin-like domain-containing protein [Neisseria sp.]
MSTAKRMHGVTANEFSKGVRAISDISTSIIGMVCTADDADNEAFPPDTPTFHTSAYDVLEKAGKSGTLARSLDAVIDQADAQIVIVRVAENSDAEQQKAEVIKGVQALRRAQAVTGFVPKILGVPELDSQDVAAELAGVAEALNAFAYVSCGGAEEVSAAVQYKASFGNRDVMLIDNDFTTFNPETKQNDTACTIARILGARAKLDKTHGWHKSISNTLINGVSGLKHPRSFGLMNADSEANTLNNANISTLIRDNGFRIWGNRTCSADPVWAFEPTVRASKIIRETIGSQFLWAMDLQMHPTLMIDIMMGINAKLSEYVAQGKLLGAQVFFDKKKLEKSRIANGIFAFDYEFTVPPPLENIELNQYVSDRFIVNLVDRVIEFGSTVKPATV